MDENGSNSWSITNSHNQFKQAYLNRKNICLQIYDHYNERDKDSRHETCNGKDGRNIENPLHISRHHKNPPETRNQAQRKKKERGMPFSVTSRNADH